jgi:hypothetical protein
MIEISDLYPTNFKMSQASDTLLNPLKDDETVNIKGGVMYNYQDQQNYNLQRGSSTLLNSQLGGNNYNLQVGYDLYNLQDSADE